MVMTFRRSTAAAALAAAADLATLAILRPHPAMLAHRLAHPQHWVASAGTDHAAITLAGLALWLTAAWVAVGLSAALAGRLPGLAGRLARRAAAVVLPRALYRAAAGAAGLGVLLGPAVATASVSHPGGPAASHPGGPAATSTPMLPAPRLPSSTIPAPGLPISTLTPDPPNAGRPAPPTAAATVTVRPGDSLWQIAADRLGANAPAARVAASWPRWFAANRAVIGPDPDHLVPGEVLHAPTAPKEPR